MTKKQYKQEVEKAYSKYFTNDKLQKITHDTLQNLTSVLTEQLQSPRRDHQFIDWISMLDATKKAIVIKVALEEVLPYI